MSNLSVFFGSFDQVNSLTKKFLRTSSTAKKLAILKQLKNAMYDYRVDDNAELLRESLQTHRNLVNYIRNITNETEILTEGQLVAKVNKKGRLIAKSSNHTFVLKYDNKNLEVFEDSFKHEKKATFARDKKREYNNETLVSIYNWKPTV